MSIVVMGSSRVPLYVVMVMVLGRSVWSRNCPYGWFDRPNSNTCYFFTKNTATNTWSDSRLKCTAAGGDLVSIKSKQEWNYINTTMHKLYTASHTQYKHWWIGLNKQDDGSTWKWADGSTVDLSVLHWKKGAAQNDKTKNCVNLYLFQMDVDSCSNAVFQSICSRPKGLPIQCNADQGWQHYYGKCYKYFGTTRTWNDASKSCQSMGAILPTITEPTTQTIVSDFAKQRHTALWTGLRSRGKPNAIQWVWQDGTQLGTNPYWAPHQPPSNMNSRVTSTCVSLNNNVKLPSTWVADNCGAKRKYYCQRPEGTCADGWLEYGAMCYQFNPQYKVSWSKARSYCQGQGGDMVAITSANIQAFLNQYLRTQNSFGVSEIWIGITDSNHDNGPWAYTNGATIGTHSYKNWIGNPQNIHGHQDCVYIVTSDRNGKWRIGHNCNQVRSFICQISTNKQVKTITQPPSHYICSDHWSNNGQFCYMFNEQDMSYDNARAWCKKQGADLVRVMDSTVQAYLLTKVQHHGDYWIGLTDRHQEGLWAWLDDTTKATYTNWNKGEPNNLSGGTENCGLLYASGSSSRNGKWNDVRCTSHYNFICQKAAKNAYGTPPTTTPKPWSSKCGPFWESDPFSANCYQFSDEKLAWYDARATCKSHGGDLASIETSEESYYLTGRIRTRISADYWIAANDMGTEGGWKWADGRAFAFLNWNAGEPNDYNHNEDCASMIRTTGRWHDQNCNLRKGFICKKAEYFVCDNGWTEFKFNCYNLNHAKSTWQNARTWCKHQHSDLARINSLDALGFLQDHVDGSGDWWIGLNDIHHEGTFVWLDDHSPSGIIKGAWKQGEPNSQGNEDCVGIAMTLGLAAQGKYNDWSCGRTMNFICQKPARMVGHTAQPQTTTPKSVPAGSVYGCPNNWRGYRGSCYYFAWGTGSFDNSIRQCGYSGAKLASIIDEAENKFVYSMIPRSISQPGKAAWIGLNDRAIEMKYAWVDGQRVTYTKWEIGEPNNWQGHDEDCVAMYTRGGNWRDETCSRSLQGAVCKKPKTIIPNSQLEIGKGCNGGSLGYHATCYTFHWSPTKTWSDAEKDCVKNKGHLATIPDSHVQAFLGAEMLFKPSAFWVGLTDVQAPGQYQWSSGQAFAFSSWYETHTGNERSTCIGIRAGHPAGLWENHNCTDHRSYICESPRQGYTTLPTTPTTTPSPIPCPQSWTAFNGICYKYFGGSNNLKTWTEARDTCQGYGGDLVSIHNATLGTFLANNLTTTQKHTFWIGLNDRDVENGYQWTDQSVFSYSNWAKGEPNNFNTQEDCVEFNPMSKTWNDYYCYAAKYYVCQLQRGIQLTTTPAPPVGSTSPLCKGNGTWYFYNNNCYRLNPNNGSDSQKTWYDARRYCMAQGGDLASIHSPDDNGFLTSMISRTLKNLQAWIGLNNLDMSGYQWSDGRPVQYLAWNIHQPDDGEGEKRCVNLKNQYGTWFDDNCNDVMGFICQKRPLNTAPRTPPPTANIPGGCPVGFSTFFSSSRCYMVGGATTGRLNWTKANAQCQSQASGANLAVITKPLENKFVITLMKGVSVQAWIGLMDKQTNGRYMWVDSTEVDYTSWAPGQPSEDITDSKIQHRRDCVMMWNNPRGKYKAGGWDDYFCDSAKAYVCSVRKITQGYVTPTPRTAGCPQGYVRYFGSCYKAVKTPTSWSNAQAACVTDGGNLVSIHDEFEGSFVDLMMVQYKVGFFWMGLSNQQSKNTYTWSDKVPVRYTRWAFNEPSTASGVGCVLQKWNCRWNSTECSDLHSYICEYHLSFPTTTPVIVGYCPDSTWTSGTDYCYKAMGSELKSWPEARYMCQRMGGELASIESQAEMAIIFSMLANNKTDIWIGLTKTGDGGFMWTDRTAVSYLNWAQNEPSDPDSQWHQDCVIMMTLSTWQWNDLDCFYKAGYICKVTKSTSTYATSSNAAPVVTQNQGPITQPQNIHYPPQNTPNNPYKVPRTTYHPINPNNHQNTPYSPPTPARQVNKPVGGGGGGMSGGAIAGVILGVLAVLALAGVGFVLLRKKYNILPNVPLGFENALYNKHKEEVSVSSKDPHSVIYSNHNEEDC